MSKEGTQPASDARVGREVEVGGAAEDPNGSGRVVCFHAAVLSCSCNRPNTACIHRERVHRKAKGCVRCSPAFFHGGAFARLSLKARTSYVGIIIASQHRSIAASQQRKQLHNPTAALSRDRWRSTLPHLPPSPPPPPPPLRIHLLTHTTTIPRQRLCNIHPARTPHPCAPCITPSLHVSRLARTTHQPRRPEHTPASSLQLSITRPQPTASLPSFRAGTLLHPPSIVAPPPRDST
jgi:hypothetical protein